MSGTDNSFKKLSRSQKPAPRNTALHKTADKITLGRMTYLGAAAALAMLVPLSTAEAAMVKLGNVDVQIDTTVSVGVSMRTAERETALLPARNGGDRKDMTMGVDPTNRAMSCGTNSAPSDYALAIGSACMYDNLFLSHALNGGAGREQYNYDSSINTDDGRLNFDDGDLTSGVFKATSDIEAQMGNFRFFTRINAFHDAILDDEGSFERSGLSDNADAAVITNIDALDFYLDWDGQIGDRPVLIRAGRQVINWGEATFILGGNSVFNSIDVNAIRRPGAEIKEALLPVDALYGSLALNQDLTVEAYIGGWDNYKIDSGGTAFANSDAFESTSLGNGRRFYVGSGAFSGSNKRNCDAHNSSNDATKAFGSVFNTVFGSCEEGDDIDFRTQNEVGNVEASRQAYELRVQSGDKAGVTLGDTDFLRRGTDEEPDSLNSDNYGLAVRYYAENLNSTEFGFYYQNYTSRIPYASSMAHRPVVGPNVTSPTSSFFLRGFTASGCSGTLDNVRAGTATATNGAVADAIGFSHDPSLANLYASDPTGVGAATAEIFEKKEIPQGADQATADAINAHNARRETILTAAATALTTGTRPVTGLTASLTGPTPDGVTRSLEQVVEAALALDKNDAGEHYLATANILGCVSIFAQANSLAGGAAHVLPNGSSTVATRYQTSIVAEYPDEIEVYGVSFNTTLAGWGVQGEVAYRPNMPLQLDGDSMSIAALGASCAWENFNAVGSTRLRPAQMVDSNCGDWDQVFNGYVREQVTNIDIGTTATFTRSNPVVSALGADLGVLLTEIGYVHMPDADHYRQSNDDALAANIPRLANQCTSGSDLPLGGVFSLDPRGPLNDDGSLDNTKPATMCRPTEHSSGLVLFGQLQYNNAFGSAWGLRPTIAYRRGLDGRSPSPAGSFIEDNESLSLSVTADYQSQWTVSLGYTLFDGDELYNRNVDRDFASLSASYAF